MFPLNLDSLSITDEFLREEINALAFSVFLRWSVKGFLKSWLMKVAFFFSWIVLRAMTVPPYESVTISFSFSPFAVIDNSVS